MDFRLKEDTLSKLDNYSGVSTTNKTRRELLSRGSVYLHLGKVLKYQTVKRFLSKYKSA